jgi:hypothetical protein
MRGEREVEGRGRSHGGEAAVPHPRFSKVRPRKYPPDCLTRRIFLLKSPFGTIKFMYGR